MNSLLCVMVGFGCGVALEGVVLGWGSTVGKWEMEL
jgi:hypothetical protein